MTDLSHSKTFLHEAIFFSVPFSTSARAWVGIIWLLAQLFGELFWSAAINLVLHLSFASWSLGRFLEEDRHHQLAARILWMSFTHFHFCNIILPTYGIKQVLGGLLRAFSHFPVTEATWHASPAVFFSQPSSMCTQDPGKQFTQPHHTGLLETDHEHSRLTKWLRGAARCPNFTRFSDFLGFL